MQKETRSARQSGTRCNCFCLTCQIIFFVLWKTKVRKIALETGKVKNGGENFPELSLTVLQRLRHHGIGSRAVSFAIDRFHYYVILGVFSQTDQFVLVRTVPVSRDAYSRCVCQLIISPENEKARITVRRSAKITRSTKGARVRQSLKYLSCRCRENERRERKGIYFERKR